MMRIILFLLLSSLSWATDNICTFSKPAGATACNGSNVCTTSGIAADSGRAYWSCTVSGGGNGYIPTTPDSIVGPNSYTVVWDDRNFDMGASGNTYYSYPAYIVVDGDGTGYTLPPAVTLTCSGSCVKNYQYYISFWVDMDGLGGVGAIRFRSLLGAWFSAASTAPTIALDPPISGTTATAHIVMQPGGGTPAILAHGSFQVQVASGYNATFRGDLLTDSGSDASIYNGIVKLLGNNTARFDSSLATPLGDGSRPMYSFGPTVNTSYRTGLDFSACAGTCTITSNVSGGHGILYSFHGFDRSGSAQVSTGKETLSHLGSAATPMYEIGLGGYGRASHVGWNMPSYTCTDCGPILMDGGAIWGGDGPGDYSFIDGGLFDSSPGEANFRQYIPSLTTGTRAVVNAIYDKGIGFSVNADTWNAGMAGYTVTNSYIAAIGSSATTALGVITTSTILYSVPLSNSMMLSNVLAPFTHSLYYFALNTDKPNSLVVSAAATSGTYISDLDFESPTDDVNAYGKALNTFTYSHVSPTTYTFTRVNISPSKTDHVNSVPADFLGLTYTNTKVVYDHLTMFGGPLTFTSGPTMVIIDEGNTTVGAPLNGFRSNLIWTNTIGANNYSILYSLFSTPSHDPCGVDGSICDYNAAQSPSLTLSCPACLHAANGYYSYFTSSSTVGGQHDYNSDPKLVDTTRRVATWYLDGAKKATPTAWTLGGSVSAGDLRASSNTAYYSAKTVAYRALRAHTASNPLRPDGPGFNTDTDGSITSVVVSSDSQVHVNLKCTPTCLAATVRVGDYVFFNGTALRNNPSVYQVNGVASDNSWFEVSGSFVAGTYTSGVIIDVWQNWWELASLYQLRLDVANGTTYTSWSYGCNACAPAQAVQQWKAAGVRPTNESLRGYTYPGDTNVVTNPGAVQMPPVGLFPNCAPIRRY